MTHKQIAELRRTPRKARIARAFELDGRLQMDCSRATGMSPQYITDVKAGRYQTVSLENAHKFAAFFGCAIEDLFPAREEAVA